MIPDLFQRFFGALTRSVLYGIAGAMVRKGWIDDNLAQDVLIAASVGVPTLLWSLYLKYKDRLKFITALSLPANSTPSDVKAVIERDKSSVSFTSLFMMMVICFSGFSLTACSDDQLKTTEQAVRKIYVGLQGASTAVEEIYQSKVRKIESDFAAEKITAEQRDQSLKDTGEWALGAQQTLRQSGVAVKQFKEGARKLPEITKDNKVELYPLLNELVANIEKARQNGLLNLERDRVSQIEVYYEMAKSGALTLQTAIQAIQKSVPTKDVPSLAP